MSLTLEDWKDVSKLKFRDFEDAEIVAAFVIDRGLDTTVLVVYNHKHGRYDWYDTVRVWRSGRFSSSADDH